MLCCPLFCDSGCLWFTYILSHKCSNSNSNPNRNISEYSFQGAACVIYFVVSMALQLVCSFILGCFHILACLASESWFPAHASWIHVVDFTVRLLGGQWFLTLSPASQASVNVASIARLPGLDCCNPFGPQKHCIAHNCRVLSVIKLLSRKLLVCCNCC